jgi:hypothetical protein
MKEEILRRFFEGQVTAEEVGADIAGSTKRISDILSYQSIDDMESDFKVTRSNLLDICDAVLSGKLPPKFLREIGFALVGSDRFFWDGDEDELLADIIYDWSCPEVNYPLDIDSVRKFKSWLTGEEPYPTKPSNIVNYDGKLISVTVKKSIERNKGKK